MFYTVNNGTYSRLIPLYPIDPHVDALASDLLALSEQQPSRRDDQQIYRMVNDLKKHLMGNLLVSLSAMTKIILALDHLQIDDRELNQRILSFLIYNESNVFQADHSDFSVLIRFIYKKDRMCFKDMMIKNRLIDIEQLSIDALNGEMPTEIAVMNLKKYLRSNLPIDGKSLIRVLVFLKNQSVLDQELGFLLSEAACKHMYAFQEEDVVVCARGLARMFPDPSIGWQFAKNIMLAAGSPDIELLALYFVDPHHSKTKLLPDLFSYLKKSWPINGDSLANLAHGLRGSELNRRYPLLHNLILDIAIKNIDLCNNSQIAVLADALSLSANAAKVNFFQKVAQISIPRITTFNNRELVVLANALSQVEFPTKNLLLNKIAEASLTKIDSFTPKSLVILADAFAISGMLHEKFLKVLSERARENLTVYSNDDLILLISSFRRLGIEAPELFHQIEQLVIEKIDDLSLEEIYPFKKILPSSLYPMLHQAIDARCFKESCLFNAESIDHMDALSRKIYNLYSNHTVIKDCAIGVNGPSIDYYVPSEKLILQRSTHIDSSDPLEHHANLDRELLISASMQKVCAFARKIGARVLFLNATTR